MNIQTTTLLLYLQTLEIQPDPHIHTDSASVQPSFSPAGEIATPVSSRDRSDNLPIEIWSADTSSPARCCIRHCASMIILFEQGFEWSGRGIPVRPAHHFHMGPCQGMGSLGLSSWHHVCLHHGIPWHPAMSSDTRQK